MEPVFGSTWIQEETASPPPALQCPAMDLVPGATQALCKELLGLTAPSIKSLCKMYHMKRAHQSGVCSKDTSNESFPLFSPSFPCR